MLTRLDFDGENLRSEADGLYELRNVRMGQRLYHDFLKPPHILTQYTPLFYLVPGLIARGIHATDLDTFFIGRSFVWISWLSVGVMIYGLARQAGCEQRFAAIGGLLWLGGHLATAWAFSYRPDSVALALSLGALLVYRGGTRGGRWTGVVLVLLIVAFLHKQSAICAWMVIVWEEYRANRFGRATMFSCGWVGALAAIVWATNRLTDGAFVLNVFESTAKLALSQQRLYPVVALVSGAGVFAGGALACSLLAAYGPTKLLKHYFVVALSVAFVSSAKAGGNVNYFLEPFAVGCILSSILLQQCWRRMVGRSAIFAASIWLSFLLGPTLDVTWQRFRRLPEDAREIMEHGARRKTRDEAWQNVLIRLNAAAEPALIEDPYLALRVGGPPYLLNGANFGGMQRDGTFDDSALLRMVQAGGFGIIVTTFPVEATAKRRAFPDRWLVPIRNRYCLAESVSGFYIYRPRSAGTFGPTSPTDHK